MIFRVARAEDLADILALLADDPLGRQREGSELAPYRAAFAELSANPMHQLIVAEVEGKLAAFCQLTVLAGLSRGAARRGQIESVRVAEGMRSRGIGAALMQECERRARAAGCRLLQLTTDKSRAEARRFYEGLGYAASHEGMKKSLSS